MKKLASMLGCFSLTDDQRREMDKRAKLAIRDDAQRLISERIAKARIPERYSAADLNDCDQRVINFALSVEHGAHGWLLLTGENGRGKSYQACAVIRHLAKSKRVEFVTMQEILDECQDTFGKPTNISNVKDHYRNMPVLVIDDFGKENPTDWSLPVIFAVIDGRYKGLKPTIITTNMSAGQMLDHMSRKGDKTMAKSVVSRLGEAIAVEINGDDWRLRNARR